MIIEQFNFSEIEQNKVTSGKKGRQLVLAFGNRKKLTTSKEYQRLKSILPDADIVYTSTSGSIRGVEIEDVETVVTNLIFEKTTLQTNSINVQNYKDSKLAGEALAKEMNTENLNYVLVLSDGHLVNGGELVNGLNKVFENKGTNHRRSGWR